MEQVQQLFEILKETPGMALWGISIFLFWKLATMASWVGAIAFTTKLFINRYFDQKKLDAENRNMQLKEDEIIKLFGEFEFYSTKNQIESFFREVGSEYPSQGNLDELKKLLRKGKEAELKEESLC